MFLFLIMNTFSEVYNDRSSTQNLYNDKLLYIKNPPDTKSLSKYQSQHHNTKEMDAYHHNKRFKRTWQHTELARFSKINKRRSIGETTRGWSAVAKIDHDGPGKCGGNSHITAGRHDFDKTSDKIETSEQNASTMNSEDSGSKILHPIYTAQQSWELLMAQTGIVEDLERLSTHQTCSKPVKSCFKSSEEFRTVMDDLYGIKDEKFASASPQKLNNNPQTHATNQLTPAVKTIGLIKYLEESKKQRSLPAIRNYRIENARRRWDVIRSYIREMAAKKRFRKATLNWAMLRHMVKGMTNPDRARQDLYVRYGLVPIILNDGRAIKKNIMLSNRLQVNETSRQICSAKQNRQSRLKHIPETSFLFRLLNKEHY